MASLWHHLDSWGPDLDVRVSSPLKVVWIIEGTLWFLWHFPPLEVGWFGVFPSPHLVSIFDSLQRDSQLACVWQVLHTSTFPLHRAGSMWKDHLACSVNGEKDRGSPPLTIMFLAITARWRVLLNSHSPNHCSTCQIITWIMLITSYVGRKEKKKIRFGIFQWGHYRDVLMHLL